MTLSVRPSVKTGILLSAYLSSRTLRREEVREKVGFSASKIIFNITTEGSDDRLIDKQKIDANRLLLKGKGEF